LFRTVGSDLGYKINTEDKNIKNYISDLGKNTSLSMFNRRKRLSELGCIKIEYFGDENKLEMFLLLNVLLLVDGGGLVFQRIHWLSMVS